LRDRIILFIGALREAGLSISMAETLDAMHAVSAIGIEPGLFRESLAAALVKDEADRPAFDAVFERFFAVPGRQRSKGTRPQPAADGQGHGSGKSATQGVPAPSPEQRTEDPGRQQPRHHVDRERHRQHLDRGQRRLARERALLKVPFLEMSPSDVEDCEALVATLAQRFRAHLSRRQRTARAGRLDPRRTLRRSIGTGGVPMDLAFRHRRPGRPDLVALCDVSHSVRVASGFLLSLLTPASVYFRRVKLFAFVDHPVEVSLERGMFVPHGAIDLYARSDFGKTLVAFWDLHAPLLTRGTILLVLGDARNNRRPPRSDILSRMRGLVRHVTWLNPEAPERWNTGDSVLATYQRHCDTVLGATNLRELDTALRRTFRSL